MSRKDLSSDHFSRGIFSCITPMFPVMMVPGAGCCVNSETMACVLLVPFIEVIVVCSAEYGSQLSSQTKIFVIISRVL